MPAPATVSLTRGLVRAGRYALRVKGDGLRHEALLDGDLLVVDPEEFPTAGALVVVEQEQETVIRRYAGQPKVRGVVVGMVRRTRKEA